MAYPLSHINRKKLPVAKAYRVSDRTPILEKNMMAGHPRQSGDYWDDVGIDPDKFSSQGGSPPMGGMMGIGGFSPLELGVMGGAMAIPAGIAAYKWWNSGSAPPGQSYGRPGDPPHPDDGYFKQAGDLFSGKLSEEVYGE